MFYYLIMNINVLLMLFCEIKTAELLNMTKYDIKIMRLHPASTQHKSIIPQTENLNGDNPRKRLCKIRYQREATFGMTRLQYFIYVFLNTEIVKGCVNVDT